MDRDDHITETGRRGGSGAAVAKHAPEV